MRAEVDVGGRQKGEDEGRPVDGVTGRKRCRPGRQYSVGSSLPGGGIAKKLEDMRISWMMEGGELAAVVHFWLGRSSTRTSDLLSIVPSLFCISHRDFLVHPLCLA